MPAGLREFIESVLMEYHPDKTIDEMYEYYGFKEIQNYTLVGCLKVFVGGVGRPTINSNKIPLLFFMLGGTGKVYTCGSVLFLEESRTVSTRLAFDSSGRIEPVDLFVQLNERDFYNWKEFYSYYTDCITDDLIKNL